MLSVKWLSQLGAAPPLRLARRKNRYPMSSLGIANTHGERLMQRLRLTLDMLTGESPLPDGWGSDPLSNAETVAQCFSAEEQLMEAERLRLHADLSGAYTCLVRTFSSNPSEEVLFKGFVEMALLQREMGHFDVAADIFHLLLQLLREKDAQWALSVILVCLTNLAWIEKQKWDLDAAECYLRRAKACAGDKQNVFLKEAVYAEHLQAVVWMLKADLRSKEDHLSEADDCLNEAASLIDDVLKTRRQIDGANSLDVARSLVVKGGILRRQAKCAEAMEAYSQALQIRRTIVGDAHPDTVEVYLRLGDVRKCRAITARPNPSTKAVSVLWSMHQRPKLARLCLPSVIPGWGSFTKSCKGFRMREHTLTRVSTLQTAFLISLIMSRLKN